MKIFNTILRYSLLVGGLTLLFSACYRRPLEDPSGETALVPFKIDWSESHVDVSKMSHASIWFFPHNGSKAFGWRMQGDLSQTEVPLALGTYSIIVFNETIDPDNWTGEQAEGKMYFEGIDKYETFAVRTPLSTFKGLYSKADEVDLRDTPLPFASWSLDEFRVVPDMVTRTRSKTKETKSITEFDEVAQSLQKVTSIVPQPRTAKMTIRARIKNIKSAYKCSATLTGMAGKIMLSTGKPHPDTVCHIFPMLLKEAVPDPNAPDISVLTETINVFSLYQDPHPLHVYLTLDFGLADNDNSKHTVTVDITDKIDREKIEIEIEIGTSTNPEEPEDPKDPPIILPEVNTSQKVTIDDWQGTIIDIGK